MTPGESRMKVVLFEDERWSRFAPLSTLRHVALLMFGTSTLLDHARRKVGMEGLALAGRTYLAATTRERTGLGFNPHADEEVLLINSRLVPSAWHLSKKVKGGTRAILSRGEVAMAALKLHVFNGLRDGDGSISQAELSKLTRTEALESPERLLFSYPWELVAENGQSIGLDGRAALERMDPEKNWLTKGDRAGLWVSPKAQVDGSVFFDTRNGPIIVEEEAEIEAFSHLTGPCFIGRKTKIHSALIRGGTTIGEVCRVGGEVENSIISSYTNKAHYGYVGNSIVGEWVNLGAGSVFSDLKNTYGTIRVDTPEGRVDTAMRKLGPMTGDMSKVAVGCRIFAGKRIGISSHTIDLVSKDVPSFVFYNAENEMIELDLKSAIVTQKRMMRRRDCEMSQALEKLIKFVYSTTDSERRKAGVRKGKLSV